MLTAGCAGNIETAEPVRKGTPTGIPSRNVENAVYNAEMELWMIPQNDPYALANFQQAYDNLASGKSIQAAHSRRNG